MIEAIFSAEVLWFLVAALVWNSLAARRNIENLSARLVDLERKTGLR